MTKKIEGGHGAPRCQSLLKGTTVVSDRRCTKETREGRKDPPPTAFLCACACACVFLLALLACFAFEGPDDDGDEKEDLCILLLLLSVTVASE